ncbi:retention module-containing protein [Castellaniella ginsengisoli]|uniref:Retention module-containing protein n=1 Tax=Castellaniella ginsengisoli TaxID=546114 RepID=A0AB39CI36_9BURK
MATDTVLISHVTGKAWMRASDGTMIALHEGMRVPVNAHILTDEGASVTLQANGVPPVIVGQNTDMLVTEDLAAAQPQPADNAVTPPADPIADQVLAALDAGQDPFAILDPTAAVLTGGGGGGAAFTRLTSVVETTSPLGLAYPRPGVETPEFIQLGGLAAAADDTVPAGPTLDIPDRNDEPGGEQGDPFVIPGTFDINEADTTVGVEGVFNFSAPAGLAALVFNFAGETGTAGGDAAPAADSLTVTLAELVAATPGAPIVIDTDRGVLTLTSYNPATGAVSYHYVSDGWQDHAGAAVDSFIGQYLPDSVNVTVIDSLGRSVTSEIVAAITDTAPAAIADTTDVTEDTALVAVGNVVKGDGEAGDTGPGDKADTLGVDPTSVQGVQAGDSLGADVSGGVGSTIQGAYGDLVLNADGSYTYTLVNDPADARHAAVQALGQDHTAHDVFTYTLTDEDGDTSTATLTVAVKGANDAPTITFGDQGADASAAVSEEGLPRALFPFPLPPHGDGIPDGTGTPDTTNSAKDNGTFTVHDVDAGDALTVKLGTPAETLTSNDRTVHWVLSGDGQTLTGRVGGKLIGEDVIKITLHNHHDGSYSYDVKLLSPVDHPIQGIEDSLNIGVPVLVSDGHATTTGNLTVNIQDDSPLAANDNGGTVTEDAHGHAAILGGNVLLNDARWGADGPNDLFDGFAWNAGDNAATQTDLSQYGTLVLGPAGGWTFVLDSSKPATQALAEGQTKDFVLKYTLTDNDGDTSEAALAIHIKGTNDAPTITFGQDGDQVVGSEEGLTLGAGNYADGIPDDALDAIGNDALSGDKTNSPTDTGSFTVTDVDTAIADVEVSLGDGSGVTATRAAGGVPELLTSHGQDIQWDPNPGGHALNGFVMIDGVRQDIIEILLTPDLVDGKPNGHYSYTVTLKGAIDHPITANAAEDVLNLNVPITVDDRQGGVTTSSLTIRVEDDSPHAGQDQTVAASLVEQPVVGGWTASFDFSDSSNPSGAKNFEADGVHIQVKSLGFDNQNDNAPWEVNDHGHKVTQSDDGLGVESKKGEPSYPLSNEIGYRDYDNQGKGDSEALIVSLKNQVATSITFELSKFYGPEDELGTVTFYRNGVEVGAQDFAATNGGGSFTGTFNAGGAEFDEVRFTARDNHPGSQTDDNSDYALKSITFSHEGAPASNPILAEADGAVTLQYGADGAGGIALSVENLASATSDGQPLTLQSSTDGLTLEAYTQGADPKRVFSFSMSENGQWHFSQFGPLDANGATAGNGTLRLAYTVTDADGDGDTGYLNIGLATAPEISIPDDNGQEGGKLTVIEDGAAVPGTFDITAHGSGLMLEINGSGTQIDPASISGTNQPVIHLPNGSVLTLTGFTSDGEGGGTVSYTYQSTEARHHTAGDLNVLDHVQITVSDSQGSSSGDLDVLVKDTHPTLEPITQDVVVDAYSTNIMLILDRSGSMDWDSSVPGKTRLQAMKEAVDQLLTTYGDQSEDVRVMVVGFGSDASSSGWLSLAEAQTVVSNLSTSGNTDYDAALRVAQDDWDGGGLSGANVQNVAYFFSDGEPNETDGTGSVGIDAVEQGAWEAFLASNQINAFAIGLGDSSSLSSLQPIGYDPNADAHPADQNTVRVTDYSQLTSTVLGLVQTPVSGDVTAAGTLIGADVDNAYIQSVTVDGETYTYSLDGTVTSTATSGWSFDDATDTLTIHLADGLFTLDLQGAGMGQYGYATSAIGTRVVEYTLHDGDNDSQTSTIVFNAQAHKPMLVQPADNTVLANEEGLTTLASTGIDAGLDIAGATIAITGLGGADLSGQPVQASVMVDGAPHWVTLTAGGEALEYLQDSTTGQLFAVYQSDSSHHVFEITGSAVDGTYQVHMIEALDPVSSYVEHVAAEQGTVNISFSNADAGAISATQDGVKLTLSAFLDQGGAPNRQDAGDDSAGVHVLVANPWLLDPVDRGGISVNNPNWSSNNEKKAIQNNGFGSGDGRFDGAGEKLVLDFSANTADGRYIAAVALTLNQFGDRQPDGFFNDHGQEDAATIHVVYTDGSSHDVTITADALGWWRSSNSDSGTQDVSLGESGKYIDHIVIGAADGGSQFSVGENIQVTWEIPAHDVTHPVTQDTLTLNLEATVTDADGDQASSPFDVTIANAVAGGETLLGSAGNDALYGGAGGDHLDGGAGNDLLVGGAGDDFLTGGSGDDVFAWRLGDQGAGSTTPAVDHITDFGTGEADKGHDALDLSDLLKNGNDPLTDYLHIGSGTGENAGRTVINISTTGGVSASHHDQQIVIDNVDLAAGAGDQTALIQSLIDTGKLKVDNH